MKDRQDMEGLWRTSRRQVFVVAAGIALYQATEHIGEVREALSRLAEVMSPVASAVVIGFILNMPMRYFEGKLGVFPLRRGARRAVALLLALSAAILCLAGLALVIAPRLTDSLATLVEGLDGYLSTLMDWGETAWERVRPRGRAAEGVKGWLDERLGELGEAAGEGASRLVEATVEMAGRAADCVFGAAISIYALFNKETLKRQSKRLLKAVLGEDGGKAAVEAAARVNEALRSYAFGMAAECAILGLLCFLGMSILRFPYALLISVMTGASQIVPIVGPWAAAAVSVLLMLIVAPERALWFLIFIVAVQQIEGALIYPRVVGGAVGVPGLWTMIAVLTGARLFGLMGAVLSVPLTAVGYSLLRDWVNERLYEKRAARQE